jgi:threonine dehydrogenase-like Zn-dependent dehydrogenase
VEVLPSTAKFAVKLVPDSTEDAVAGLLSAMFPEGAGVFVRVGVLVGPVGVLVLVAVGPVGVLVFVAVGPVGVFVLVAVAPPPPGVGVPIFCHNAGAAGGDQSACEVCAWRHL